MRRYEISTNFNGTEFLLDVPKNTVVCIDPRGCPAHNNIVREIDTFNLMLEFTEAELETASLPVPPRHNLDDEAWKF